MADITITIPNAQVQRVVDALATYGGYVPTPQVPDANDVLTPTDQELVLEKREFARKQIIAFVKQVVLEVERREAAITTPDVT